MPSAHCAQDMVAQAWTVCGSGWQWQEVRSRKSRRKTRRGEESDEDDQDDEEGDEEADPKEAKLHEIVSGPRSPAAGPRPAPATSEQRTADKCMQVQDSSPKIPPTRRVQPCDSRSPGERIAIRTQEWTCKRCTLINSATAFACQACAAWRSSPSQSSPSSPVQKPQAPPLQKPRSWSWREKELYPWAVIGNSEWKVIVENTFITVMHGRDRAARTSLSAPARLDAGKASSGCQRNHGVARPGGPTAHGGLSPVADQPLRSLSGPDVATRSGGIAHAVGTLATKAAASVQMASINSGAEAAAGSPPHRPPAAAQVAASSMKVLTRQYPYQGGLMKVAPAEAAAGAPALLAFHRTERELATQAFEVHIADEAASKKIGKRTSFKEDIGTIAEIPQLDKDIYAGTQAIVSEKLPIVFPSGALHTEAPLASDLHIDLEDEEESIPELEAEELEEDSADLEQEQHMQSMESIDIESMPSLEGEDSKEQQVASPREDQPSIPCEDTPTAKTLKNRRKRQALKAKKAAKAQESDMGLLNASGFRDTVDVGHRAEATARTWSENLCEMTLAPFALSDLPAPRRKAWSMRRHVRRSVFSAEEDGAEQAAVSHETDTGSTTSDDDSIEIDSKPWRDEVVQKARRELLGQELLCPSDGPTSDTAAVVFMDRACGIPAALTCDAVDAIDAAPATASQSHQSGDPATTVLAMLMRERAQAASFGLNRYRC